MWRDQALRRRINACPYTTNLSHLTSQRRSGRPMMSELFHPYRRPIVHVAEESKLSSEDRQLLTAYGWGHLERVPENTFPHYVLEENRRKRRLLDWYKRTVVVDADDKKRSVAVVCSVLRTIMETVRSQNGGNFYSGNLIKAGSYAVKTKIGKADEFDWLLPLNAKARRYTQDVSTGGVIKKFGARPVYHTDRKRLIKVPVCSLTSPWIPSPMQSQYIDSSVYTVPAALVRFGKIVPRLLKNDLHAKIQTAIKATGLDKRGIYLSPDLHHGPALKLTIVQQGDHNISVDITPSLPSDLPVSTHGWHCQTIFPDLFSRRASHFEYLKEEQASEVLRAGTHFVPKEDEAFKLSYSKAETALYRRLDGPNECRKMCHKVIKKLVQKFLSQSPNGAPGISSYIFKHQLLHMDKTTRRNPRAWDQSHFRDRLSEMLIDCARVLRSRNLRNYFNSNENVLAGKDRVVLNRLADHFLAERVRRHLQKAFRQRKTPEVSCK